MGRGREENIAEWIMLKLIQEKKNSEYDPALEFLCSSLYHFDLKIISTYYDKTRGPAHKIMCR